MRIDKVCIASLVGALAMASVVATGAENVSAPAARIELPESSPLMGGWTGTIGKNHVLLCFAQNVTSYYYASHLFGRYLTLSPGDATWRSWQEADELGPNRQPTGYWKLDAPSGDVLEGTWSDPKGKLILPITLERDKSPIGSRKRCDFYAMHTKLGLKPEQVGVGKVQEISGIRYRGLSALDGSISSIEFVDAEGKFNVHNKKLHKEFQDEIAQGLECQEAVAVQGGNALGWPYNSQVRLDAVHGTRWITLTKSLDYFCAGAHPNTEFMHYTVDAYTGEAIQLPRWVKHAEEGSLPGKLEALVTQAIVRRLKARSADDECIRIYAGNKEGDNPFGGYDMALGGKGIVFSKSLPHVAYACTEEVEIPFSQLRPYLTQEGKDAVKLLSGD